MAFPTGRNRSNFQDSSVLVHFIFGLVSSTEFSEKFPRRRLPRRRLLFIERKLKLFCLHRSLPAGFVENFKAVTSQNVNKYLKAVFTRIYRRHESGERRHFSRINYTRQVSRQMTRENVDRFVLKQRFDCISLSINLIHLIKLPGKTKFSSDTVRIFFKRSMRRGNKFFD